MKTRYVDCLGTPIYVGDIIMAYTKYNGMKVYKVLGETEHKLKVSTGGKPSYIPCNTWSVFRLTYMDSPEEVYKQFNKL